MDNPTLAVANVMINIFFSVNLLVTAIQRKLISLYFISAGFMSLALGFIFILSFESQHSNLTGPMFNIFLVLFFLFFFAGIRPYAGLAPWPARFWSYFLATLVTQVLASTIIESYFYRLAACSVMNVVLITDTYVSTLMLQRKMKKSDRYATRIALLGYGLYISTRMVLIILNGKENRFLIDSTFESTVTLIFMMISSGVWATAFSLIDNQKVINILQRQNDLFEQQSITDQLTGFRNRRYLERMIIEEISRHNRYQHKMAMILLDIDHFKKINDQYGHPKGDQVLIELTKTISACSRDIDISIRMGGEEFMTLLPETGLNGARELAERIRSQIERLENPVVCPYTVSLGISEMGTGESFDSWYSRTDHALYTAKTQGRNRVIAS